MDYELWLGLVISGGVVGFLIAAFIVMIILKAVKHNKIITKINEANIGDPRGNKKLGFYPEEDEGSFGKESFKLSFEDDGDVDIGSFTLSAEEKATMGQDFVVEHDARDAQVRDFNAVSGSVVGYQQPAIGAPAQMPGQISPGMQQPMPGSPAPYPAQMAGQVPPGTQQPMPGSPAPYPARMPGHVPPGMQQPMPGSPAAYPAQMAAQMPGRIPPGTPPGR